MSITYNLNIPAAANNPSVDQPNMQTNTNSINSLVAVDHYTFADNPYGTHKQITFPNNNSPGATPTYPTLFTNNDSSSIPQLFYYNAGNSTYYTNGANGSCVLLGGMILKWGSVGISGSSQAVTFGVAFPHNLFGVTVSALTSTPGSNGTVSVENFSVNGFTAYRAGSGSLTVYYFAIGN